MARLEAMCLSWVSWLGSSVVVTVTVVLNQGDMVITSTSPSLPDAVRRWANVDGFQNQLTWQ